MKVFILQTSIWKGTVMLKATYDVFETKELAEKCIEKLKEINTYDIIDVRYILKEGTYFKSENEVPILNN
jgi:hypothetical protein